MLSTLFSTVLGFLWHILSGDAYRLWQEHKLQEAISDENKVASMSDSDVASGLQQFTRKRIVLPISPPDISE